MTKALLLIDIQKTFRDGSWGHRNNESAELNAAKLLNKFRQQNDLVIHINHRSENPSSRFFFENAGFEFQDLIMPLNNEIVISKYVNSAFIGTNLKALLDNHKIDTLVIVGLTAPHCVSTTARMAANYGYRTILVEDSTASFAIENYNGKTFSAQEIHDITIATLHDEFAQISSTKDFLVNYHNY
ncbi:cysteine hydrolase [Streptococcus chenjunshii]|uniref:Cysteine hydrolase n=1 Tax=Streptococcus chenjunshii TaxID=2173853 RepID=A0A372KN53_9STRE|nr:cysteine hydrolase family protein [Streptococcus chenjunshii]AXQ77696.1 cysteine hydrolase [Streptococcus chenjunshii]RFU50862.1 cysteine hydrolase [Streptococcus chenjunshii]RFU53008.1 cysteine hydrolase [Streptococcus chenjunshii]